MGVLVQDEAAAWKKKLLKLADEGLSQQNIAKTLGCSPSTILRSFRKLEKEGVVEIIKGCPTFYKLIKKNKFSMGETKRNSPRRNTTQFSSSKNRRSDVTFLQDCLYLHDYKVKFRIMRKGIPPKGIIIKYHNWKANSYAFARPFKHKILLTTRSIIVFIYKTPLPRNMSYEQKIHNLTSMVDSIAANFAMKNGYGIDIIHSKVISQHISANPAKVIDENVPDQTVATLRLARHAKSVKGMLKEEAKAWVDKSSGLTDIESNDLAYERMLLELPIKVNLMERQFAAIGEYTEQIRLHMAVQRETLRTLKSIQANLKRKD